MLQFRQPGGLIAFQQGDWRWYDARLQPFYEAELFDAAPTATISTITAAALAFIAQPVTVNARRSVTVTAASLAMTGQAVASKVGTRSAVVAAGLAYAGQSVTVNKVRRIAVTAAGVAFTAGQVVTNAVRVSPVASASLALVGQVAAVWRQTRSFITGGGSVTYQGGSLDTGNSAGNVGSRLWQYISIMIGIRN